MTVSGIASANRPNATKVEAVRIEAAQEPITSRAVLAVEPVERTPPSRTVRPDALFVTHLIAMTERAPQTCALRRENPAVAQLVYNRMLVKGASSHGKAVSQVA